MPKLVLLALVLVSALRPEVASAADECRVVDVDFTPSKDLQIVAWIEDAAGNYVDTAFITQATGLRGLGNRTGVMDLKSGPRWPYGAREDVLPIWAHRHGLTFPAIVWQSGTAGVDDCYISRPFDESSTEQYFCRPLMPTEPEWDTGTCASLIFSDKGKFSDTLVSHYPPRADVIRQVADSPSVEQYAEVNPFDTVSQATPPADTPYRITWQVPPDLSAGDYVMRVEVSKELDFNETYPASRYPTTQCGFYEYGVQYRGQPSVIYDVPFTLGTQTTTSTSEYAGYSDLDGIVHAPDATITSDTPGSGASRMRVAVAEDSSTYRVRATTRIEDDAIAPDAIGAPAVSAVDETSAKVTFTAPGDDGDIGTIAGYEIRYVAADTLDEATFTSANRLPPLAPAAAGQMQTLAMTDLAPGTMYSVGIRAYDNCRHLGPLAVVHFETPTIDVGCGCRSSDPGSALFCVGVLALRVRRRRSR